MSVLIELFDLIFFRHFTLQPVTASYCTRISVIEMAIDMLARIFDVDDNETKRA